jgi:hydrogenase maturation factor
VTRFADAFQFDPLQMISSGTLVATVPPDRVTDVAKALAERNIVYGDVGCVTDGIGVSILREDKTTHYHDIQCEEDELARLWALYPRKE